MTRPEGSSYWPPSMAYISLLEPTEPGFDATFEGLQSLNPLATDCRQQCQERSAYGFIVWQTLTARNATSGVAINSGNVFCPAEIYKP